MSVLFFCVHGKWTWVRQWQIFREPLRGKFAKRVSLLFYYVFKDNLTDRLAKNWLALKQLRFWNMYNHAWLLYKQEVKTELHLKNKHYHSVCTSQLHSSLHKQALPFSHHNYFKSTIQTLNLQKSFRSGNITLNIYAKCLYMKYTNVYIWWMQWK